MRRVRRGLPVETLASLRLPHDVRMSPDGRHVVYAEARADMARDRITHALVLLDVRTGAARALTAGTDDEREPCWSPNGGAVVFVCDRGGGPNLWRLEIATGAASPLTRLRGAVRQPRLSPDGTQVAFLHAPAARPGARVDTQLRHRRGSDHDADAALAPGSPWMHLWLLDLRTRRTRRLTRGNAHAAEPAWSPDGRTIAFVAHRSAPAWLQRQDADLCVVARRGGTPRTLVRQRGPKFSPVWSPAGTTLAYLGAAEDATLRLWTVPARGGRPHDVLARSELACGDLCLADATSPTDVHPPVWSPRGTRLFFLASRAGSVDVYGCTPRGGALRRVTSGRHHISEFSPGRNGRVWALVRSDPCTPADVFVARVGAAPGRRPIAVPGPHGRRLTHLNTAALRGAGLVRPRAFRLPHPQGHVLHGFVWHARASRRGPAVLALYPELGTMAGWSFVFELQALVAAGCHVFVPNLRGTAGYGRDFQRAVGGKWGFEDHNDLDAVADWVAQNPGVDATRLALVGRGHGGFLTHWALGHSRRFRCAISTSGPVHFASLFGTSDARQALTAEFLAPPWETHERYWRTSPLAFVDHIRAPLLLFSGDDDRHCPPAQAEEMFAALALRQRDVEWVSFAGAAHDFDRSGRPRARIERLRRMLDWLQRKL